jgi:tRNA1Val (adenine37-N6)-methyltransferase
MRRPGPAPDSSGSPSLAGVAKDALFSGQVTLFQPERGYRVTVDTLLLADFAVTGRPETRTLVDLGAGVGGLALAVAHLAKVGRCALVEREPALATLAKQNLAAARLSGSVHVADLARGLPAELAGTATMVASNPPFFAPRGHASPGALGGDTLRKRSRGGELAPFLLAAAHAMGRRAYAFFVYPAPALTELLVAARAAALVPKRLRLVHAFAESPARIALVEFRRAKPGGLVVEPPLIEWVAKGRRSPEVERILRGEPKTHHESKT